ncbi:MAG: alpha-mannosidase [Eubacterium sp.]
MEKKRAYAVATSHLDTVWRWNIAKTIEEYLPDTIEKNFKLIEKYPKYKFNFEGAYRYELIEEFYPLAFEQIKKYVDEGRWCVSGSSYENGDVNIPSPEAIFRNILLGNKYFEEKFNKKSSDLFLPDCFGFGWALPSIAKNAGLKGFSTQKLSWGSAKGLPFDLGIWKGPDGNEIFTSLDAKSYRYKFSGDIRADISVINKVAQNAQSAGLPWANHLYGTGDWGGAPTEESVKSVQESVMINDSKDFDVISARTDEIFEDMDSLTSDEKKKLPVWNDELLMTSHGAGCYTSRGMSKRLNRKNEVLADMTERACCFAHSLGNFDYPRENLNQAWKRVLKHHFHDDITGTSLMEVYNDSWNDYFLSLSQFKNEYLGAMRYIVNELDTSWVDKGECVVVNNPTQYKRCDAVKVNVKISRMCRNIRMFDQNGNEVPSQFIARNGKTVALIFLAEVDSFGYNAYKIIDSDMPCKIDTGIKVTNHTLENKKFRIIFNRNGDIASLYDKKLKKQLLDAPIKMALLHDVGSLSYPSWEIRKEDIDKEPYCYANTPEFTIIENGPARVSLMVKREAEYSTVTQIVSLTPESEYVEVKNIVNWKTRRTMLKATFPFSVSNKKATYDLGLGVIQRPNNTDSLYEVPAQRWADLTDESGEYGISIFSDCKYGWDKPNDNTLRLTCIHTPSGAFTKETRQDLQDIGRNIFGFAIYSHEGGFDNSTQKQSELYANPIGAVQTTDRKKRSLDNNISFLKISNDDVIVRAVKMCEDDDSLIIRVNEAVGKAHRNVSLKLFKEIGSAELVNASEEKIRALNVTNGSLRFNINPFEVKTFKIKYKDDIVRIPRERYRALELEFNAKGFTTDSNMRNVILQGSGFSLPYELLKNRITVGGVDFKFPQKPDDRYDVLVCRGQEIEIPVKATKVYFIAASTQENQLEQFSAGGVVPKGMVINSMSNYASTWDMAGLEQNADIYENINLALEFTHTHHPEGNLTQKAKFFMYEIDTHGFDKIVLPENNKIVILAMTAVKKYSNTAVVTKTIDTAAEDYNFDGIPPIDKIIDKADFITIRAGKIQDQIKSGKGKGIKRDNIITNIIRSYTKSEW